MHTTLLGDESWRPRHPLKTSDWVQVHDFPTENHCLSGAHHRHESLEQLFMQSEKKSQHLSICLPATPAHSTVPGRTRWLRALTLTGTILHIRLIAALALIPLTACSANHHACPSSTCNKLRQPAEVPSVTAWQPHSAQPEVAVRISFKKPGTDNTRFHLGMGFARFTIFKDQTSIIS